MNQMREMQIEWP